MRVEPTLLCPRTSRWHFPMAFLLLFVLLLVVGFQRNPSGVAQPDVARAIAPAARKYVVVAKVLVEPGEVLNASNTQLEKRLVSEMPKDVLTHMSQAHEQIAAGPIPAGFPIVPALIFAPAPK